MVAVHDASERPETARRQTYSRFNVGGKGRGGGGGGEAGEGLLQSQAPAVSRKGKARGMQLRLGACGLNVRGDVLNRADALGSRDDDDNDDDGDDKTKKAGGWSPGSVSRTIIYESHYRDAPRPETFSNGARPDDAYPPSRIALRLPKSMYRQISDYRRDAVTAAR